MSPPNSPKQNGHVSVSVPDERTPLIAAENAGATLQPNGDAILAKKSEDEDRPPANVISSEEDDRPLPKFQIFVLCYARLVEPVAFFSIFPFVNAMIYHTDAALPESDVGFYSGLIESLFSLTQMCSMIFWGRLADRFGRRPILIISLLGVAVGMTAFGFATSVWQMIAFRCFAGVFSGSLVTIRAMFSEHSTPKTQARAFSFFAVSGNLGIFVGPFIGGGLSEPVTQYPGAFKGNELFTDYPYSLATMVSGGFAVSAAIMCILFLDETLKPKGSGPIKKPMSMMQLLKEPGVGIVLFMYSFTTMIALGWTAVAPVFWWTSPSLGGYGCSNLQISMFLAISGASQALWTLFVFPPWQRRVGTGGVLRVTYALYPFLMFGSPIASILRRTGHEKIFWVFAICSQICGSAMSMSFTANQLALNDSAPSHETLGTLNAIALTFASAIRSVAPAAFTSFYALGVRNKILGGYLIWALIIPLGFCLRPVLYYVPERIKRPPLSRKPDPEESESLVREEE